MGIYQIPRREAARAALAALIAPPGRRPLSREPMVFAIDQGRRFIEVDPDSRTMRAMSRAEAIGHLPQAEPMASDAVPSRPGVGLRVVGHVWSEDPRMTCSRCPSQCGAAPDGGGLWRCLQVIG